MTSWRVYIQSRKELERQLLSLPQLLPSSFKSQYQKLKTCTLIGFTYIKYILMTGNLSDSFHFTVCPYGRLCIQGRSFLQFYLLPCIFLHFSAPTVYHFLLMRRRLICLQQMEKKIFMHTEACTLKVMAVKTQWFLQSRNCWRSCRIGQLKRGAIIGRTISRNEPLFDWNLLFWGVKEETFLTCVELPPNHRPQIIQECRSGCNTKTSWQ